VSKSIRSDEDSGEYEDERRKNRTRKVKSVTIERSDKKGYDAARREEFRRRTFVYTGDD